MHIFIDESGNFALPNDGHSVSVMGALVIPEARVDLLYRKYERVRANLPKEKGEVKGRLLTEAQTTKVLDLLRKNCCIFEAVAIDMGLETPDGLKHHREGQAEALTKHLTEEHHPKLVAGVWDLRKRVEGKPFVVTQIANVYRGSDRVLKEALVILTLDAPRPE